MSTKRRILELNEFDQSNILVVISINIGSFHQCFRFSYILYIIYSQFLFQLLVCKTCPIYLHTHNSPSFPPNVLPCKDPSFLPFDVMCSLLWGTSNSSYKTRGDATPHIQITWPPFLISEETSLNLSHSVKLQHTNSSPISNSQHSKLAIFFHTL